MIPDPIEGHDDFTHLRQVYYESEPNYKGRFTVPVLYDKIQKRIVNNESSEILRMLNSEVCCPPPVGTRQPRPNRQKWELAAWSCPEWHGN